jgi:hypothetical protein
LFWHNTCPFTQSEYLRILNLLLCYSLHQKLRTDFVNNSPPRPFWTALLTDSPPALWKEAELHRILIDSVLEYGGRLDHTPDISNLVRLAELNINACSLVLEELRPLITAFSDKFKTHLFSSLWQILLTSRHSGLNFITETIMCQIFDQGNSAQETTSQMLVSIRNKFLANLSLSPSATESRIGLWSKCLQRYLESSSMPPEVISEEIDYILLTIHPLLDELMVSLLVDLVTPTDGSSLLQ